MDNQRVFVWAALALVLWLNYTTWQRDYAPRLRRAPPRRSQPPTAPPGGHAARAAFRHVDAPRRRRDGNAGTRASGRDRAGGERRQGPRHHRRAVVDISLRGGELVRADLLQYPQVNNRPDVPVRLFNRTSRATSRSRPARGGRRSVRAESSRDVLRSDATEYRLEPGGRSSSCRSRGATDGITVTKTYTFRPGTYRIDLTYDVKNDSGSDVEGRVVRAARASLRARRALVVQGRDLRVPRPGDLRRQGLSQARRRGRRRPRAQANVDERLDRGASASLRRGGRAARRTTVRPISSA